jgi:hypothetical protein
LSTFPTKSADASSSSSAFQTDDIVAFKTLTLCMETFQPVLSDWQCGQIVDVLPDDQSVTLIPYTLSVASTKSSSDEKKPLTWAPSQPHMGEDACESVGLDGITELRFLHGPTKIHLDATLTSS